jgi:hypothetical protein
LVDRLGVAEGKGVATRLRPLFWARPKKIAETMREAVLSSIRPELLAKGGERGSNEHQDGQAEENFACY